VLQRYERDFVAGELNIEMIVEVNADSNDD